MAKRVTYIISNIEQALAFQWIVEGLSKQFDLSFILLNPSLSTPLALYFKSRKIPVYEIKYKSKKELPFIFFHVLYRLTKLKPAIVHTHMVDAALIGQFAAWVLKTPQRINTRHFATFHHQYHPKGVWLDKLTNRLCTAIIAISQNVKGVLIQYEKVAPHKIHLIHHGFALNLFAKPNSEKVHRLKQRYNPFDKSPIIGVIARYQALKGIQYIIPAFEKLLADYPNALLLLANAKGVDKKLVRSGLNELPVDSYVEIEFEKDVASLYHLMDVYVHVPVNSTIEAFGQTYVESLAAGIPSIFTLSGVAHEFIDNERNALVVPYQNSQAIYRSCKKLLRDEPLRGHLINQGGNDVQAFELKTMLDKLKKLYDQKT